MTENTARVRCILAWLLRAAGYFKYNVTRQCLLLDNMLKSSDWQTYTKIKLINSACSVSEP